MRIKRAIVCMLGAVTLAALAGPAGAQPVTYHVELYYQKIVDGPRPVETVRLTLQVPTVHAVEVMCGSSGSFLKLGRRILPATFGLAGRWMAAGGRCVLGEDGKIEMTVEPSSEGSD